MPILPAFHGKALSRKISITVPHHIEKCCILRRETILNSAEVIYNDKILLITLQRVAL